MAGSLQLHHYCHTHNTVWWLKLTCMFFSNLHFLLSCPRYMYLKMPKKVRPGRPTTTTTHSPKHCINVSYLADFICLSDRFLNNRCMLDQTCFLGPLLGTMGAKNLYPCGLLLWISVRLWRQDKACVLHACYYNHYKISAIQDTMKTS